MSVMSEINRINNEVITQTSVIEQIADALDGKATSGGGNDITFTEVTYIPSGRTFSIPCDFDRGIIFLQLTSTTNLYGGIGYNGQQKNIGMVQWTNDGTGYAIIVLDNVNLRMTSAGVYKAGNGGRNSMDVALTERALNIQPHWINSDTECSGGYYIIKIA